MKFTKEHRIAFEEAIDFLAINGFAGCTITAEHPGGSKMVGVIDASNQPGQAGTLLDSSKEKQIGILIKQLVRLLK